MPENIDPKSLFAKLDMQDRARDFLARAVASGHTGQSYLFVGAPGAGKLDAAYAVAQAILCEREEVEGACGACDACVRVVRHTHPDVRYYAPESATGYLIAQTRALLDDVPLAPIRSTNKVYIIDRAEQLRANTANALLKTLEEPPLGVTFILLGTSTDVMLPTIVSRCQCVPFRAVSPTAAAEAVARATGLPMERCRAAVAVAGSPARGIAFLKSADRQEVRRQALRALDALPHADEADVLSYAKDLVELVVLPKKKRDERIKGMVNEKTEKYDGFLEARDMKRIEDTVKRELSARERSGMMEALAGIRSLLRDTVLVLEGVEGGIVNEDAHDTVERLAACLTPVRALQALDAVADAERCITRNVTPQLTVEVMLFDIRKALICR